MAKKVNTKKFMCNNCKFFTDKCEHKSNTIIQINRKIEKVIYKTSELKTECKYFE